MKDITHQFQNLSKIVIIITILLSSCSKSDDTVVAVTPPTTTPPTQTTTELVLAAGNAKPINDPGAIERAIIWRDGIPTYLTPANKNSFAKGFDTLNTSTVVCGTTGFGISGPDVTKATLWLNTDQKILENNPTEYSEANAVKVSTSNLVYTVGYSTLKYLGNVTYSAATLWQGTTSISKTLLTTQVEINNGASSSAYGLDIDGANVYVAGLYQSGTGSPRQAVIWKNGAKKELTTILGSNSCANAVEVTNGKVYVTGYITVANKKLATLWIYDDGSAGIPQEITLEAALFNNSESYGLNIFNTGSITYVYGINSGSNTKSNCFGRQWKYENSVVVNKYFGEDELTTTLCNINYGNMITNVSSTGPLSSYAAGDVSGLSAYPGKNIPCFWKNNGNRTNIETTLVNSGTAIGSKVL
jgi:hypothetical protein